MCVLKHKHLKQTTTKTTTSTIPTTTKAQTNNIKDNNLNNTNNTNNMPQPKPTTTTTTQNLRLLASNERSSSSNLRLPARLHSRRKEGCVASPLVPYSFIIPCCAVRGSGNVNVIGLWNLRRLGSIVTQALAPTRLPSSLLTSSVWIGRTWRIAREKWFVFRFLFY